MNKIIFFIAVGLFLTWGAPVQAKLPPHAKIVLADSCYADFGALKDMFSTGMAPARCQMRFVDRASEAVLTDVTADGLDLKNHLIGMLRSRVNSAPETEKERACMNFFTVFRAPESSIRNWGIFVFSREILPQLPSDVQLGLSRSLGAYWGNHRDNEVMRRVLVGPLLLVVTPDTAADILAWVAPFKDLDTDTRALGAIAHDTFDTKREHPAVQRALITHYGKNTVAAVRKLYIGALTTSVRYHNERRVFVRVPNRLTLENIELLLPLLDVKTPRPILEATLEILSQHYAMRFIDPERAGDNEGLHQRLAALMDTREPWLRQAVAEAYHRLHPANPVSQQMLVQALADRSDRVRGEARIALDITPEVGSGNHTRHDRVREPKVFEAVIQLLRTGDEKSRSDAVTLLSLSPPVDLRTVSLLAQVIAETEVAVLREPLIDVLRRAARRRTGLRVQDTASETTDRLRLQQALSGPVLSAHSDLRQLLMARALSVEQIFAELDSGETERIADAAQALAAANGTEIRGAIHDNIEERTRRNRLAALILTPPVPAVRSALLASLAKKEVVLNVGRYPELYQAALSVATSGEPAEAHLIPLRAIFYALSQKSGRLSALQRNDALLLGMEALHQVTDSLLFGALLDNLEDLQPDRLGRERFLREQLSSLLGVEGRDLYRERIAAALTRVLPLTDPGSMAVVAQAYLTTDPARTSLRARLLNMLVVSYQAALDSQNACRSTIIEALRSEPRPTLAGVSDVPEVRSFGTLSAAALELLGKMERNETVVEPESPIFLCVQQLTRL